VAVGDDFGDTAASAAPSAEIAAEADAVAAVAEGGGVVEAAAVAVSVGAGPPDSDFVQAIAAIMRTAAQAGRRTGRLDMGRQLTICEARHAGP
jgi:hypothetical protein